MRRAFTPVPGGVLRSPLETERLVLARPEPDERGALVELLRAPGLLRSSIGVDHAPADVAERWLDRRLAQWDEHGIGLGTVRSRADGDLLGLVGLRVATHGGRPEDVGPGGHDLPGQGVRAEVIEAGWRIHPAWEGRGLAREAIDAWLRIAFDELAAERVGCQVDVRNERSLVLARRLGFRGGAEVVLDMPQHADRHVLHLRPWVRPRDVAAALLERFAPRDDAQRTARERALALCARDDVDVLGRDDAGHLTGSALVVDAACRRVLLLWHEKVRRWVQPGGHLDGDWDLLRSAAREAEEETGIDGLRPIGRVVDVDVHVFRAPGGPVPDHEHHDVRTVLVAPPGAEPVANAEARRFRWRTLDELEADPEADASVVRLARHGLAAAADRWAGGPR